VIIRASIESGTVFLGAFALLCLVDKRMELWLLPSVAERTIKASRATLFVLYNYLGVVPVRADFWLEEVFVRFSSVVLPVVCVHAERSIVCDMGYRTKGCLIVEHEKVRVEPIVVK